MKKLLDGVRKNGYTIHERINQASHYSHKTVLNRFERSRLEQIYSLSHEPILNNHNWINRTKKDRFIICY